MGQSPLDTLAGLAGLIAITYGAITIVRLRHTERRTAPRLCSCTHGSGAHDADGCHGQRVYTLNGKDRLIPCACTGYDASGNRIR